ncbi:MAG TPA: hypothetical protein VGO11_19610 [Chthoniobacteraceae bacterium]|jgi:hypothetical protein|nr:hypothetical protein [Chthoniobacteraceae bacterium]
MPATDVKFGITRHTGALIESVESTDKIEKKVLKGSTGNSARVHPYDPTTDFSVKGHGTLTVVPGIGSAQITDITGGVTVIDSVKNSEYNEDFDGWEYSGTNYPNAQEVS